MLRLRLLRLQANVKKNIVCGSGGNGVHTEFKLL